MKIKNRQLEDYFFPISYPMCYFHILLQDSGGGKGIHRIQCGKLVVPGSVPDSATNLLCDNVSPLSLMPFFPRQPYL